MTQGDLDYWYMKFAGQSIYYRNNWKNNGHPFLLDNGKHRIPDIGLGGTVFDVVGKRKEFQQLIAKKFERLWGTNTSTALVPVDRSRQSLFNMINRGMASPLRNAGAGRRDYINPKIDIDFSGANKDIPASNIVLYDPSSKIFSSMGRSGGSGAGRRDYINPKIDIDFSEANKDFPESNIVLYDPSSKIFSSMGRSGGSGAGRRDSFASIFTDTNWAYNESPAADPWTAESFAVVPKEQADRERAERIRENESREKVRNAKRQSDLDALKRRRKEQEQREEEAYQARRFKRRERREAYERFPWLKSMAKSNPIIAKNLPSIAKSLKEWSKMPFVGGLIKHPLVTTAGIGFGLASAIVKESDKANKTVTEWQNSVNLYGTPPKKFEAAARAAGYSNIGEISKLYGHMTMRFADPMMALRSFGPMLKNAHPLVRMRFASDYGLDEKSISMFDIFSGKTELNTYARRVNQELNKLENEQTKGFASDASWYERLHAIMLMLPFEKSGVARARSNMYKYKYDYDKYDKEESLRGFYGLESAVNSQDAYQREYSTGASNGTGGEKNINVNVTTGDVVLPNAQNGNDVIKGIINYSANKSDCEAVLHMFDSKTE